MELDYKEKVVFAEENWDRLDKIVQAGSDYEKLSKISLSFIVMDLTWRCNHNCRACIDGEAVNRKGDLPIEIIEDIFDYANKYRIRGLMTMGGEVFLYKKGMKKALEKSIQYKIPLKTVTNGTCLKSYIEEIVEAYKIPGSQLRVSINSDRKHYKEYTRNNIELEKVLEPIREITSRGTLVDVSTIIFPQESKKNKAIPNIDQLESIIRDCEEIGVKHHVLISGRDPKSRRMYKLSDEEKDKLRKIKRGNYALELIDGTILSEERIRHQNLNFSPCPSGFLFVLIGSNGKIYKCTDNRGREDLVLGTIKKPGDFEKFWHSAERVKKQMETKCKNKGCVRYKINVDLQTLRDVYEKYNVNLFGIMKLIPYEKVIEWYKKLKGEENFAV